MIRTHFYNTQRECLIGLTEQLFKHFNATRFVESNVVRHYKLRRKYEPEQNDNPQKQLHFPPPLLALPGGETGKQLAKLWSEEYAHCDLWHKLHYYWTEEECVPSDNADSCFGSMRDQFFSKLDIDLRHIHPIHGGANPDEEASRYARTLCRTRGLYYDPALYPNEMMTHFESYFHCAILDVDEKGYAAKIRCFHNEDIESFSLLAVASPELELSLFDHPMGAAYFARKNRTTGRQHISASIRLLMETPRLLIPIFGKDRTWLLYNMKDFFNPPSTLSIIRNHPNVHLFIVNDDYEDPVENVLKVSHCHFQYEIDQLLQETD